MKNLTITLLILTATGLLSMATLANNNEKEGVNSSEVKNTMSEFLHQYTLKLQSIPEAEQNKQLVRFIEKLNTIDKSNSNSTQLKSGANKAQKLDSLLVERWNDNTGQLEPSQLERWTWNEKDESESWELYDIDTLTNQWYPNDKEEYAWDENGNKTMHMDYDPDSLSGEWAINGVETSSYNSNGDELEQLFRLWDNDIDDWVNYAKVTQEYDALLQTAITQYEWNTSEETWDIEAYVKMEYNPAGDIIYEEMYLPLSPDYIWHTRYESFYDSLGNQNAFRVLEWDLANNKWAEERYVKFQNDSSGFLVSQLAYERTDSSEELVLSWKIEFTNNNAGELLRKVSYDRISDDSTWIEDYQMNYEYDVTGEISYRDYLRWDTSLNQWTNSYKRNYLYNTNGMLLYEEHYNWDTTSDAWIGEYQENYSFNTNGKLIHKDQYNWDTTSNDWIGEYQENYAYDADNNYLSEEKQVWDTLTNDWADLYSYDFTYDLSVPFSEIAFPFDFTFNHLSNIAQQDQYTNKMVSRNYSEQKNGQLELTEKTSLFYSKMNITGISELTKNTLNIYPNPATDFIAFKGLDTSSEVSISLYNLQGKKILTEKLNVESKVNINHLKSGIYIYELTNDTEVFRGKISKK